jgi:hypothetical protein
LGALWIFGYVALVSGQASSGGGEAPDFFDEVGAPESDALFRIRARDSMGALRPDQAAVDAALASGYARGLEEARMDALDRWRTMLMTLLEAKFGELSTESLDRIEEATEHTIERWIVAVLAADSLEAVFATE